MLTTEKVPGSIPGATTKCNGVLGEQGKPGTSHRLPQFPNPILKIQKSKNPPKQNPYRLPDFFLNFRKGASNRKNAPQNAHQKSPKSCQTVFVIYFYAFQKAVAAPEQNTAAGMSSEGFSLRDGSPRQRGREGFTPPGGGR